MRLGRDGDIEEWLATDSALDRPVLIRSLDPAASDVRRRSFVRAVRAAAAVNHMHLANVYEVNDQDGTYSVLEWNGGVSIADRLRAGDTLPVHEFLPNAAGLAEGLSALHTAGVTHGAIDTSSIQFSAAHPAKLGGFGRQPTGRSESEDTKALAKALRQALTGSDAASLRPSQVVEGLPRNVDDAIAAAEAGTMTAAHLGAAMRASPFHGESAGDEGWSWRWLLPAVLLLGAALLLGAIGLGIDVDPDSPFLFPATPQDAARPEDADGGAAEAMPPPTNPEPGDVIAVTGRSYDPFGDNQVEREEDVPLLLDGDGSTGWRTERYFNPLPSVKPGVGVVLTPASPPRRMVVTGSEDTSYEIGWAPETPADLDGWDFVTSGTLVSGPATLQLPERDPGVWLLWLTSLPEQGDGEYWAEIREVVFTP